MNRLLQVAFTALVLMFQAVGARSLQQPQCPTGSTSTGLALEITYLKDKPPAFSPVVGPNCKLSGAWYTLFNRTQSAAPSSGSLPVKAVDVRSRLEGEFVRVTVSVFLGVRFLEKKEQVATYELKENERVTTVGLMDYGIEPFEIKVLRVDPKLTYAPAVSTKAQSISIIGIEQNNSTLPSYKLTLQNTSNKNVVAIGINVFANNRRRSTSLPQGKAGRLLIEAGGVYHTNVSAATDAQITSQGYRPESSSNQDIVIATVVFDDGSFEGDVTMAANFTAFVVGRKIQLARLISLIDSTSNLPDANVTSALEQLKAQVSLLSTEADPVVLDQFHGSFPGLTTSEHQGLKTAVDVALHAVKSDFLDCIKAFEKKGAQSTEPQFRAWLGRVKTGYEKWLSRLERNQVAVSKKGPQETASRGFSEH